ncbi:hypothetical protein [Desulfurispira natronophila]|uniref:Rubrerythrin n=1 Tax=Desulfurispira natronophila TaxID=682562 RepID=A0A7W7Y2A6_9BACT|nr:hypothetical protein [Desulfurispira natronophila]MBB5020766.1 rubrerythrin [Desulfurispira natronophila]
MQTEPDFCPFCGTQGRLDEIESSILEYDSDFWLIYHWVCQVCGEQFDKVELSDYQEITLEDDEDSL